MRRGADTPWPAILAAGLVLAWPAAWNGYPLVFADTGTYLGQAILRYLGWDRPPHYSLFLRLVHWRVSLWPVPIVQGIITAHLLALLLRTSGRPGHLPLLLLTAFMAVATGLPWLVAQLMPDLFTGIVVLASWLLGFRWAELHRRERAYLVILGTGAIAVHLTHLPLALGLVGVGAALAWIGRGRRAALDAATRMAAPVGFAIVALIAVNAVAFGRFTASPHGSVFLAARLMEDGPAMRTLHARCADEAWRICALLDQLPMHPNEFLWLPEKPLRNDLGGGRAWAPEAEAIVAATLAREPGTVALLALCNAAVQFTRLVTGDGLQAYRDEPGPEPLIRDYFPRELRAYQEARQSRGLLLDDVARLQPLHVWLAAAGLLALPLVAWRRRRTLPQAALCVMALAAAAGNAVVTGGLSGVNDRYQGRIAWLFVLVPAVVIATPRREPLLIRHPVEWRDMA